MFYDVVTKGIAINTEKNGISIFSSLTYVIALKWVLKLQVNRKKKKLA